MTKSPETTKPHSRPTNDKANVEQHNPSPSVANNTEEKDQAQPDQRVSGMTSPSDRTVDGVPFSQVSHDQRA